MEYLVILNLAFFASISHCVGMCGGIAIAISQKAKQDKKNAFFAHILYNLGRIATYCLIGALCGGLGIAFEIKPQTKAITMIVVGVSIILFTSLMFVAPKFLSFSNFQIFKDGAQSSLCAQPAQPKRFLGNKASFFLSLYRRPHLVSFFLLGILNGFLPCGIVYYFALIAFSSGSMFQGILVMAILGVCTLIPMVCVGAIASLLCYRVWLNRFCFILMLLFGFYTLYKGIKGL